MRTQKVSVILALAVWLLISPGLIFAQQDSLPGSSLPPQGGFLVPLPAANSDTVITVTKLPYPKAKIYPHERSEQSRLSRLPSPLKRGRRRGLNASNEDYDSCIQIRLQLQLTADLTTLQESKKGAWLKYLPSVSAGLAPAIRRAADGSFNSGLSPTLSIGLNSSLIYQSHREKQQRKATREAIIKQNQLQEATQIAQLHRLQRRLQTEIDKLNLHSGVTDIDRQLFTLYQKQYDNHDISPEEYLLKRKAFLLQELRTQDQLNRIQSLHYQVEDLAGCLETPIDPNFSQKNFTPLSKR
jgi:hypothetical protein